METIDEITHRRINLNKRGVYRIAIRYSEGELIFGYTRQLKYTTKIVFTSKSGFVSLEYAIKDNFDDIFYCPKENCYYSLINMSEATIILKKFNFPQNTFPYSFARKYEAIENFDLFYDKQVNSSNVDFPISEVFKYTFGLEFETSMGVIPEKDCFEAGLIPLRDGSISGIEYATIKLEGNSGFNLLKKQLNLLRRYTHFNKDCSLHVHLGGFPLEKDKIWNLYKTIYYVTRDLRSYLPDYCFQTSLFKSNGKDYCKVFPSISSFESLFKFVTGENFFGSFVQPHRNDLTRERKWNVPQRYYMCNFVNLLCYNVNKTVEFRFLSPTFNLEKILTWLYIFNAILLYAENSTIFSPTLTISRIIETVYPPAFVEKLNIQLQKLNLLRNQQSANLDFIGSDLITENRLFELDKVI